MKDKLQQCKGGIIENRKLFNIIITGYYSNESQLNTLMSDITRSARAYKRIAVVADPVLVILP